MQIAHFFVDGDFQYILNVQYSSIGYSILAFSCASPIALS